MRRQLRRARARPRPAPERRDHRRRRTTAGRSGSSCRSSTSWYDADAGSAPGPIAELVAELDAGTREPRERRPDGRAWRDLTRHGASRRVDAYRLAYLDEAPVNWCPALGTVLANEEVTADGRSERGNFPVYRRPLKQWMLRITAYADRLLADLDLLDWPDSIKLMQRNWIGRSDGAAVDVPGRRRTPGVDIDGVHDPARHAVRRHLHGARARASAGRRDHARPSGPTDARRCGSGTLRARQLAAGGGRRRTATFAAREVASSSARPKGREKTGVFTGAFARSTRPTASTIPIFIADYVLMGYGTGAIMAVPAHDQRDFEFARRVRPADRRRRASADAWLAERGLGRRAGDEWPEAYVGDGCTSTGDGGVARRPGRAPRPATRSSNGSSRAVAARPTVTYKLRDWLFSRQRYWGEPFPIVYDDDGLPGRAARVDAAGRAARDRRLRADASWPTTTRSAGAAAGARRPTGSTSSSTSGDGPARATGARRTRCRSGRARAGTTCATSTRRTRTRSSTRRSSGTGWGHGRRSPGGVDLYVGGVEHAVLHLLYARFWHKVLFDLGHVSTPEPFQRLFNQGTILAAAFTDERGVVRRGVRGRATRRAAAFHDGRAGHARATARWARA